jgi:MFS transporter, FHS family, glucose/mannose:H+ symporter
MNNQSIKLSLFINYFVFGILLNSVGTVILQVQNSYGVSESAAGILEAFKDLSIAFTSFLVASFVARIGYRRCMLLALGFVSLVALAMPQLPTFWMAKFMFAATGISFALIKVSVFAALGLVTNGSKEHVSLMNFLESFFMVGVLSGYFIFGHFVDDNNPSSTGWLNAYYVLAALSGSAFILLLLTPMDESSVATSQSQTLSDDFSGMLKLCVNTLVVVFVLCAFLYVLIEQSIMSWLPTFNSSILNLPASLSIQMASILAASTALGRFVAAVVFKWVDWFKVLCIGLALAAVLVLLVLPLAGQSSGMMITGWRDAPLAAFIFPLVGFCLAPVYPAINSVILSALPCRQHAPMAGLIVVFSALGGTTGSLVTGHLFEAFGGKTAFYFSLIPLSILLLALYLLKRQTDTLSERGNADLVAGSVH